MGEQAWTVLDGASFIVIIWLALWQIIDRKNPLGRTGAITGIIALAVQVAVAVHLERAFWSAAYGLMLGSFMISCWANRHEWRDQPEDEHCAHS